MRIDKPSIKLRQQSTNQPPVTSDATLVDDPVALVDDPVSLVNGPTVLTPGVKPTVKLVKSRFNIPKYR